MPSLFVLRTQPAACVDDEAVVLCVAEVEVLVERKVESGLCVTRVLGWERDAHAAALQLLDVHLRGSVGLTVESLGDAVTAGCQGCCDRAGSEDPGERVLGSGLLGFAP